MQIVTMAIARATQFVSVVLLTLLGVQLTAAAIGTSCPYTLETVPDATYYAIPAIDTSGRSSLVVSVMACDTAFLRLDTSLGPPGAFVEIVFGDVSQRTTITDEAGRTAVAVGSLALSCTEFRSLWVTWDSTGVGVGTGTTPGTDQLVQLDVAPTSAALVVNYVSVKSVGAAHRWNFGQQGGNQGLFVNQTDGVVTSPVYSPLLQLTYTADTDCQWVIATVQPWSTVQLRYLHFDLQDPDANGDCVDKVTVRNLVTDDPPSQISCGKEQTATYDTHRDLVHLAFRSDAQVAGLGFAIQFRIMYRSGYIITGSDEGHTSTPNYPDPYPPNSELVWTISVDPRYRVTLTFSDFDLEVKDAEGSCSSDVVTVYEGLPSSGSELGRFCGDDVPLPLTSDTSVIGIKMTSDMANEGRGFVVQFSPGGCVDTTQYGTNCDQPCPCMAANTLSCSLADGACHCKAGWEGSTCSDDIDECVTGALTCSAAEFRVCVNVEGGASCECSSLYREVDGVCELRCGGELSDPDGSLSSPNFESGSGYPPDVQCTWTIRADPGSVVNLTFHSLHLKDSVVGSGCVDDYVSVDPVVDLSGAAAGIRYVCGQPETPIHFVSTRNQMEVRFVSDDRNVFPGFVASYRTQPVCGGHVQNETGVISSPVSLGVYPPHSYCPWVITLPAAGFRVALTFTFFDLETHGADRKCGYDAVDVSSAGDLLGSFCGTDLPPVVTSPSNAMTVVFRSDGTKNYGGFSASFGSDGCVSMLYGTQCDMPCACDVTNTRSCDPTDGTCYCKAGWEGVTCGVNVDECSEASHNCTGTNQACRDTRGGFECVCQLGFLLHMDGVCQECPEGQFGQSCSTACTCDATHTESCDHVSGACNCKAGWEGVTCNDDVDECMGNTHGCQGAHEVCVNTVGSYRCRCAQGYSYDGANVCQDIDECADSSTNECSQHCLNHDGGFSCACDDGYNVDDSGVCRDSYYRLVVGLSVGIPVAVIVAAVVVAVVYGAVRKRRGTSHSARNGTPRQSSRHSSPRRKVQKKAGGSGHSADQGGTGQLALYRGDMRRNDYSFMPSREEIYIP